MTRTIDYDNRRRMVLAETINRYIKNAAPVSSIDIAKDFGLSPATIRNIFSELEGSGYLTHPHTSAGRIPTQKGYRYYVDLLNTEIELLDDEKNCVVRHYQQEAQRLEDALEKTSEVLSMITHYTSIVSFLEWHDKILYKGISLALEQPEFQDMTRIRLLLKLLEEKESLLDIINRDFNEKVRVYIGHETGYEQMDNYSLVVSSYSVKNKPSGRLAVLGPVRMEYKHIIPALEYVSDVLSDVLK